MTEQQKVKMAQAVKELRDKMAEELPMLLEQYALMARMQRYKYNAAIKEGFTPEQALELCKQI